ncbi:RNA polymerase sigma factor [Methylobacterium oryzisoli]|uniref:RNA polymerase sigma factor n=1 Tax=Methylobacterium oryzisoli TaxID=3385502 RepID=UPI003891C2E5
MRIDPAVEEPEAIEPSMADALAALSDADLARLEAVARLRVRALPGLDWSDLLHEAVLRALEGTRRRPPGLPLPVFLAGCMRSLCNEHWRRLRRERQILTAGDAAGVEDEVDPGPHADPERILAASQALQSLFALFRGDGAVLAILGGLADGLPPPEIRARHGLSETEYDNARKRMRRALLRLTAGGTRPWDARP